MNCTGTKMSKKLEKEQTEVISLPDVKIYYKAIVIRKV